MSINRNRAKLKLAQTSREYNVSLFRELYPPYWDDGVMFYPIYKPGYINPNKRILSSQMRAYRSWKYNRKTQWKK